MANIYYAYYMLYTFIFIMHIVIYIYTYYAYYMLYVHIYFSPLGFHKN